MFFKQDTSFTVLSLCIKMRKQIKAYKFHFVLHFQTSSFFPFKRFHPLQNILKLNCPFRME